jgi:hypothetical protein
MKVLSRRGLGALLWLPAAPLLLVMVTGSARGDMTKDQCIEANTRGQDLVHDGKLRAAHAELQSCSAAACPAIIRNDCVKRLDELSTLQPAVVFEAKDASGSDLTAVTVTMDGVALAEKLDGTALKVDPGPHVFVFTAAGQPTVTKKLVLAERDQSRREVVVFPAAETPIHAPPVPVQAGAETAAPSSSGQGMSTTRVLGLVGGGLGIAGVAVGSVFGLLAGSALSNQRAACASPTNCTNYRQALAEHSTFLTDSSVSTAGFVAGGVLLAAGVTLFVVGGKRGDSPPATGVVVSPEASPRGAGLTIRGAF